MTPSTAQQLLRAGRMSDAERAASASLERAPSDVDALQVLGLVALRSGNAQKALQYLERALQVEPGNALSHHYAGRVHDALGNFVDSVAAHARAIRLNPELYVVRLHLGAALERAGQTEQAAIQYLRAMQDAQAQGRWLDAKTTAPAMRPTVEHAVRFVRERRRVLLEQLIAPLRAAHGAEALCRVEQCLRIYLGEEPPVLADSRQRPTFLYFPGLPAAPYPDRSLFPWIDALEADTDVIRQELMVLLRTGSGERVFDSEAIERENLRGGLSEPSWNGYYFYRHGERRDDNCSRCPRTADALARLPLSHVAEHGPEVLFSVFGAGTHLAPHRGVTNTRLVGHLPLIVPEDCALNVAGELHEWREGGAIVFDDTYEHEAWNRSREMRVVMIFDIWNPHLTPVERSAVASLVEGIGDLRREARFATEITETTEMKDTNPVGSSFSCPPWSP